MAADRAARGICLHTGDADAAARHYNRGCNLFITASRNGDIRHIEHWKGPLDAAKSCGHRAVKQS
jgi:hypothetical protein